jgi:hypothetical protein
MMCSENIVIDGEKYVWDGEVFHDKNSAKTNARRYLRRGFKVHMKSENGNFYIYRYHPFFFKEAGIASEG